jgi:hypothetical protein
VGALRLDEGRRGDYAQAAARLDRPIEQQLAIDTAGLILGMTHEAHARGAIWAGDRNSVEHFGTLTAKQSRHGRGSS